MRGNTACGRLGSGGVVEHNNTDLSSIAWFLYHGSLRVPWGLPFLSEEEKTEIVMTMTRLRYAAYHMVGQHY
jgi:hypothetical protein